MQKKSVLILNNVMLKGLLLPENKGPPVEITEEFTDAYKGWKSGSITAVGAMKKYGIKRSSFYKLAKQYEKKIKE